MKQKFPWPKFIFGIVLFAFFHQLYDFFPNTVSAILSEGAEETIFAHMKMLFYPYLIISIVDYFLHRRKGTLTRDFIYARMLILISVPWIMISFFYIPDSLGITFAEPLVLIFSILVSWLGVYTAIRLEEPLDPIEFRPATKGLIVLFFISAIIIYTGYAFNTSIYRFL